MRDDSQPPDDIPPIAADRESANPFRPTEMEVTQASEVKVVLPPYDAAHWSIAIIFTLGVTAVSFLIPFFAPMVVGSVMAFLRVPILRSAIW